MNKRKFSPIRLYKLIKWIVIIVSTISLILAVVSYMDVENNRTLHKWERVCQKESEDSDCMLIGLSEVNDIREAMYKEFMIGIFLPTLFFGGGGLYRWLFPKEKKE